MVFRVRPAHEARAAQDLAAVRTVLDRGLAGVVVEAGHDAVDPAGEAGGGIRLGLPSLAGRFIPAGHHAGGGAACEEESEDDDCESASHTSVRLQAAPFVTPG